MKNLAYALPLRLESLKGLRALCDKGIDVLIRFYEVLNLCGDFKRGGVLGRDILYDAMERILDILEILFRIFTLLDKALKCL